MGILNCKEDVFNRRFLYADTLSVIASNSALKNTRIAIADNIYLTILQKREIGVADAHLDIMKWWYSKKTVRQGKSDVPAPRWLLP